MSNRNANKMVFLSIFIAFCKVPWETPVLFFLYASTELKLKPSLFHYTISMSLSIPKQSITIKPEAKVHREEQEVTSTSAAMMQTFSFECIYGF